MVYTCSAVLDASEAQYEKTLTITPELSPVPEAVITTQPSPVPSTSKCIGKEGNSEDDSIPRTIQRQKSGIGFELYSRVCSGIDFFDLKDFLKETAQGRALLNEYNVEKFLCNQSKNTLTDLIINHFINTGV